MDASVILRKTHKGLEEIERRTWRVPPRERLLLIQVDGKKSLGTLAGKAGFERDGLATARKLIADGFIEEVPSTGIRHPPRQESPPGAGHVASLPHQSPAPHGAAPAGGVPLSRPMSPRGPVHASAHAAAAASRPAASHAAMPATKPSRPVQAPPARSEPRPANWLTSTVAHLTNLFTAADSQGDVVARDTRPAAPPHPPPPAPRRPVERNHHVDLVASIAHEPVVDLTDPSDLLWREEFPPNVSPPEFGRAPLSPDRAAPAPPAAVRPAGPRPPVGTLEAKAKATPFDLAAYAVQAACAGCSSCPGNSVSLARDFMNNNLLRFSGNGETALTQTLDQCRTLAELQRQFEPWLRGLLLTAEGRAEAPSLVTKLQILLLQ